MLPKFANPHLLRQATQIVSRADLDSDDDVSDELSAEGDRNVARLEQLLRQSLGEFQLNPEVSDTRKRKKTRVEKETKDEEGQAKEEEAICASHRITDLDFAS